MPRAEGGRRWLPRDWKTLGAEAALEAERDRVGRRRAGSSGRRARENPLAGVAPPGLATAPAIERLRGWFHHRGWQPFGFQEEAWAAYAGGESGLIHVPTGAGKTYAAYVAPLAAIVDGGREGLQLVYITPLRAVARDIESALRAPIAELGLGLAVESRTGDTSPTARGRQRKRPPHVLLTTPESLSLLLTYDDAEEAFSGLRAVIVDEWHELLATKRGTQVELALARLRSIAPASRAWALSATVANLREAARAVTGTARPATLIGARLTRPVVIETVLPNEGDRAAWSGAFGLAMLPAVLEVAKKPKSTLVFTNTRTQAERWFQALRAAWPGPASSLALHHGSLDRAERERVEEGLKTGSVRLVVATSSLDLGVDFSEVERVVQVGSPKGVARLMQRAGRAAHRPGAPCTLVFVPAHALELLDIAAARASVERGEVEARCPVVAPLDVLVQHLVSRALGGGFTPEALFDEVRTTVAYENLSRGDFDWALALVCEGGRALGAYPDYRRVIERDARYVVDEPRVARLHRMGIGTIVSDAMVRVRVRGGADLGVVDEAFVARLRPGDGFFFAGRALSFVAMRAMVAEVRPARGRVTQTPLWRGGRSSFSSTLGAAVRAAVGRAARDDLDSPELRAAGPMLEVQARLSHVPHEDEVLVEAWQSREGHHLFVYPFEGRAVHEGLAALLALRLSRLRPATFALSANDYGFELLSPSPFDYRTPIVEAAVFTEEGLESDAAETANVSELAKRQFREIARVAGLIVPGPPGAAKSTRQVQASAALLYDVFARYDPGNLLLEQARREVLDRHFERPRLGPVLARLRGGRLVFVTLRRPTPLSFPLVVERAAASVSNESLLDRIERMKRQWARGD